MNTRPKLFVSYAHETGVFPIRDYIAKMFTDGSRGKYDLLVDKGLQTGEDLSSFMSSLDSCFGVIMLLTPTYKNRVMARIGGVYEEFTRILQNKSIREEDFFIWPILVSGTIQESVPAEIESKLCLNLTKLHILNGQPIADEKMKPTIEQLRGIIKHARGLSPFTDKDYYAEKDRVRKKLLFDEPWAEFNKPQNRSLIEEIIVTNNAVQNVSNRDSVIIKGRKGSGKSTLTQVIPYIYSNKFLIDIPVNANKLDLDNIFTNIVGEPEIKISKAINLKRKEVLKIGWKFFIHLLYLDALLLHHLKAPTPILAPEDKTRFYTFLKDIHHEYDCTGLPEGIEKDERYAEICMIFFPYAITKVIDYIAVVRKKFPDGHEISIADWNTYFTEKRFFQYSLTDPIINILRKYTERLAFLNKKILFTLDNFENAFYDERKSILRSVDLRDAFIHEELAKRATKDTDLLYALIQVVYDSNRISLSSDFIFSVFSFCITIPEDIYFDIERMHRDSYVFINKVQTLNWTGVELMQLLIKRIEKYTGKKVSNKPSKTGAIRSDEEILKQLFSEQFPDIPAYIDIEFNNLQYNVPLFIYILRHTFWRPREIILYYANIISTINTFKQRNIPLTQDDIKIIVRKIATHIIETEFINEFSTHCVNIEDIISRFKHRPQILSYHDVTEILDKAQFQFTSPNKNPYIQNTLVEKIWFLYQIGFLGIVLSPEKAAEEKLHKYLHKYCFIFNAGSQILLKNRLDEEKDFMGHTFIIHPVFFEYLSLTKEKNEEFVLNFDHEYLRRQDKFFTLQYA